MAEDDELLKFDPNYPDLLPKDWKNYSSPSVYEILATLNTLKKMYARQLEIMRENPENKEDNEFKLRRIATNYQTIKAILFQPR